MKANNKIARIVGILFIIGTGAGILSGVFTIPILSDPIDLSMIATNSEQMIIGAIFVLIMGFALAMIPILLYPIFKAYNEIVALGAILFRGALEAVTYIGIVICWLLLVSLSHNYVVVGASTSASYATLGTILVEAVDWIGIILAIVFSIGALMLYYLFYQTKLVPRWLSGWGFVGAILYFIAPWISMFNPQTYPLSLDSSLGYLMIPLAIQEMVFAVWLIIKGFNSSDVLTQNHVHNELKPA